MKCPTCVAEGERSEVYRGGGISTLMTVHEFYDEDGDYRRLEKY